jgi:hypothetical protein
MRFKGLGKLIKFDYLIGPRTRDLPASSIVPQPTTLPLAPVNTNYVKKSPETLTDADKEVSLEENRETQA